MSDIPANGLSREKIRQLLAAIGSQPVQDEAQGEVTDYDWHQPHYFSCGQLDMLNNFVKKIADIIGEKFAVLYRSDFNVTVTSVTQHFAGNLFEQLLNGEQINYYLAFGSSREDLFGFVSVSEQTAATLVTELLGEAESKPTKDAKESDSQESQSKPLSQLEESLLFDIAEVCVESLAISLRSYKSGTIVFNVLPGEAVVKGRMPIELQGIEEVCKIVYSIEKAAPSASPETGSDDKKQSFDVSFIIPCSKLVHYWPVVRSTTETSSKPSADDNSKAILNHLKEMPVTVTAQLGTTMFTFEQVTCLDPCDILLLDKTIDEPIELIVEERTVFRGQLVKSSGQYAAVITEISEGNMA
jgi:flagellar motor switch protein FliM